MAGSIQAFLRAPDWYLANAGPSSQAFLTTPLLIRPPLQLPRDTHSPQLCFSLKIPGQKEFESLLRAGRGYSSHPPCLHTCRWDSHVQGIIDQALDPSAVDPPLVCLPSPDCYPSVPGCPGFFQCALLEHPHRQQGGLWEEPPTPP